MDAEEELLRKGHRYNSMWWTYCSLPCCISGSNCRWVQQWSVTRVLT